MLIYTPHTTTRIEYIFQYFKEKLFTTVDVTNDVELFKAYKNEKLNYSQKRICNDEFYLQPTGLLTQQTITKQSIECFEWKQSTAFFKTEDDLGFDIFSAIFYLISRFEEYVEYEPDEYGRYAHWNSLAWKERFLNKPVVDIWINEFRNELSNRFPDINYQLSSFNFLPTYDIDIAWRFKNKGFWRNLAAAVSKPSTILQRLKVVSGKAKDPFDCYDWLHQFHNINGLKPIYFFLVAKEKGELDKNCSPKKKALQQLIQQRKQMADVGLHPSVLSNTAKELLPNEKNTLQQIINSTITKSRHHYLKFYLPHTYREVIGAGITDEYSMGYGTVNGFRASTSHSFLWYDLEKEDTTSLRIHPFAFMEANSFYELHQTPSQALEELKQLYSEVKNVSGTFVTIFHNQFLGTDDMFKGWREMYEEFIMFTKETSVGINTVDEKIPRSSE